MKKHTSIEILGSSDTTCQIIEGLLAGESMKSITNRLGITTADAYSRISRLRRRGLNLPYYIKHFSVFPNGIKENIEAYNLHMEKWWRLEKSLERAQCEPWVNLR